MTAPAPYTRDRIQAFVDGLKAKLSQPTPYGTAAELPKHHKATCSRCERVWPCGREMAFICTSCIADIKRSLAWWSALPREEKEIIRYQQKV